MTVSAFILTSCSNEQQDTPTDNNAESPADNAAQNTTEASIFDILPAADFNGDTFTVYIPPNPDSPVDKGTFVEEEIGEVFNDAVFKRNRKVENEYNVNIERLESAQWYTTYDDLNKDVMSGDLRADVYFTHIFYGPAPIIASGLVRDWTDIPHLDFEKPWWNQTIIKNLNIANKVFYISGSMSIQDPPVIVFNKAMLQALALEDPYKLVREGKWTIDKLSELSVVALKDLNGDGKYDQKDDCFGFEYGITWQTPSLMYACDEIFVQIDDDGYPNVQLDNQRKIEVYEKIYNLLWDGDKTYCYFGTTSPLANWPHIGIDSGRVLFCQYTLLGCEVLRAVEVEYGILPLPKYDENQKDYMTNSWTGMYCLPINIPEEKFEMIGTVMEAMSALGYKEVVPVYYEILLKEKVSRDDDSRDMLDIILNSMVFDAGLNYEVGSNTIRGFITTMFNSKNKNYVSEVEKQKEIIIAAYDKLYQDILAAE